MIINREQQIYGQRIHTYIYDFHKYLLLFSNRIHRPSGTQQFIHGIHAIDKACIDNNQPYGNNHKGSDAISKGCGRKGEYRCLYIHRQIDDMIHQRKHTAAGKSSQRCCNSHDHKILHNQELGYSNNTATADHHYTNIMCF